ncbi:RNA polymerase sigma-70 factor [Chitinophaga lutea]
MNGRQHNEAVLRALQARDADAFADVYRTYYPLLYSVARRYLPHGSVAEEIIQDVFLLIWERSPELDHAAGLKNYLCKAVANRCLNHLQREQMLRRHHEQILLSSDDSYVSTFVEEQELRYRVYEAIERLPARCREIFKLSRFEGLKNGQIAQQLGLSVKTVENQMTIALRQLRAELMDPREPVSGKARRMMLLFIGG